MILIYEGFMSGILHPVKSFISLHLCFVEAVLVGEVLILLLSCIRDLCKFSLMLSLKLCNFSVICCENFFLLFNAGSIYLVVEVCIEVFFQIGLCISDQGINLVLVLCFNSLSLLEFSLIFCNAACTFVLGKALIFLQKDDVVFQVLNLLRTISTKFINLSLNLARNLNLGSLMAFFLRDVFKSLLMNLRGERRSI